MSGGLHLIQRRAVARLLHTGGPYLALEPEKSREQHRRGGQKLGDQLGDKARRRRPQLGHQAGPGELCLARPPSSTWCPGDRSDQVELGSQAMWG